MVVLSVFLAIFPHFVHFVPLSHVRQNEFLIHFALTKSKGSSFSTTKLLSKQENLSQKDISK